MFDVIVANPPYSDNEASDTVERVFWDAGHKTVTSFFRNAGGYLKPKDRLYCSWPNFADFGFLESLARGNGYSLRVVGEACHEWKIYRVYEMRLK